MINLKKNDAVAESIKQIMEKELSAKQKKIAALAGDKKAIDALDLAALRAGKKPTSEDVEQVEENAFDWKKKPEPEPNGGSGVKKGTRYGGSKQKDKPEQDTDESGKPVKESAYFKQRLIEKSMLKKAFKALTGGSDEDQRKDLQRKMGVPQTGQKPTQKEEVELDEKAPPGFEGTVKAMKKHKEITNPFALAWSMKNKGYKSHKKSDGSDK